MVMSAAGALMIRLKKGPLDLAFAKGYIEKALNEQDNGIDVTIGEAYLIWSEITDPLLIDLQNVDIKQEEKSALQINEIAFTLSGMGLLKGEILPAKIIIDKPSFRVFNTDGSLNDFWKNVKIQDVYGPVKPQLPNIDDVKRKLKIFLKNIASAEQSGIKTLSDFKQIRIKDVVLQGSQEEGLALLNLTLKKNNYGLNGYINISYPEKNGEKAHFNSDISYRRQQEDVTVNANVKNLHTDHISPFFKDIDLLSKQDLVLNGDVKAALDNNLNLDLATVDLSIPSGQVVIPDKNKTALPLKNIAFNGQFNAKEKEFDIKNFNATIEDIPITASSKITFQDNQITAPIQISIEELALDKAAAVFPKYYIDTPLGVWLTKKLSKGTLSDIVFNTNFNLTKTFERSSKNDKKTIKRSVKFNDTTANFKGKDVTVKYSKTLAPVTDVIAEGNYKKDTLTLLGSSANILDLKGKNIKFELKNLSKKGKGIIDLNLDASGPVKSVLNYISAKPILITKEKLPFDRSKVKGNVDFNLHLNFPALKKLPKEKVKIKVDGVAQNLFLPSITQGLSLSGGPYDVKIKDGKISLDGKGKLDNYDIDVGWEQYLNSKGKDYSSKISAKLIADNNLCNSFGINLNQYIDGTLPIELNYVRRGTKTSIDITGDLTPTIITIDRLQYNKQANIAGTLNLTAHIEGKILKEVTNLKLNTEGFSTSNANLQFRQRKNNTTALKSGILPNIKMNKNTANVNFEITSNDVLQIQMNDATIDITPFLPSKENRKTEEKKTNKRDMHLSITAKKIYSADKTEMKNVELYIELNKSNDPTRIEMDADMGKGRTAIRFKPNAQGKKDFYMDATDAGYTLKALGIYNKIREGNISISAQPQKGSRDLFGSAQITDFKVRKTPALAKLLGAMSLNGANDLLNNDGLAFTKLKSEFELKFKDEGNLLVVENGRTSGNSLGLTFEGVMNMATNTTNISGTIIPLSGVNKVIGQIPIIGDMLTGGDALIAATYTIKGPSDDPSTVVNPLSVLAPGFLRKILFEGDVDRKVKKEEAKQ